MSLQFFPSVSFLLNAQVLQPYIKELSFTLVSEELKKILEQCKKNIISQSLIFHSKEEATHYLYPIIKNYLNHIKSFKTQRVINATGILIHTNLGRAPLNEEIWNQIKPLQTHYSSLEIDLTQGKRGKRKSLIPQILCSYLQLNPQEYDIALTNNNAAGMLLALSTFKPGQEVIVSRGELVQIGGGFRVPDILQQSGLILKEVGTTNITTLDDYKNAINENTAIILKVHTSNFSIQGFTKNTGVKDLAQICPPSVKLLVDQGSGLLKEDKFGERSVQNYLLDGADMVLFSGDKMLGAVQAGIAIGKKNLIIAMESHPLMRALRTSKIVNSYLEAYLINMINHQKQPWAIDIVLKSKDSIKNNAIKLQKDFSHLLQLKQTTITIGGGSTPDFTCTSYGVELLNTNYSLDFLTFLRQYTPPILGYIQKDKAILDLSALLEEDFPILYNAMVDFSQTLKR